MAHIHVIHENAAWLEPLAAALNRRGLPWRDWFLDRGVFDLSRPPPKGRISRMVPSAVMIPVNIRSLCGIHSSCRSPPAWPIRDCRR